MVCKNCHCRGLLRRWLQGRRTAWFLRLAKLARVLVRFDHVVRFIVNANHNNAHRDDGKRFIVRADEKVTALVELEAAIRACGE